ncbi:hypothetical protein [Enterococcus sp. C76]
MKYKTIYGLLIEGNITHSNYKNIVIVTTTCGYPHVVKKKDINS